MSNLIQYVAVFNLGFGVWGLGFGVWAEGMSLLKRSGAHTIGQDEDTCVIYGMPRVAKKIGAVVEELPLHQVSDGIMAAILAHGQQRRRRMDP